MDRVEDRIAAIERVMSDPPTVHPSAPGLVWNTAPDCYKLLAERCPPGTRTLETGLGVSTVLFALWGTEHRCVVPWPGEVSKCVEYLSSRGIASDRVRFEVGFSNDVLPALQVDEIDLYLIDGAHSFPAPALDWFYGARWLKRGGTLVIDDLQLPAVAQLQGFLDRDPRWVNLESTQKWTAYRRESEGDLAEPHWKQPFFTKTEQAELNMPRRLRHAAGKLYRSVRSPARDPGRP